MKSIIILLLCAISPLAWADIYSCQESDGLVYRNEPCKGNGVTQTVVTGTINRGTTSAPTVASIAYQQDSQRTADRQERAQAHERMAHEIVQREQARAKAGNPTAIRKRLDRYGIKY